MNLGTFLPTGIVRPAVRYAEADRRIEPSPPGGRPADGACATAAARENAR